MKKVAENVVIRHVCHCHASTQQPAPDAETEHVFTIDDQEFPWHITERGPVVTRTDCGYVVSVEIFAQHVDATGVPILDERHQQEVT